MIPIPRFSDPSGAIVAPYGSEISIARFSDPVGAIVAPYGSEISGRN